MTPEIDDKPKRTLPVFMQFRVTVGPSPSLTYNYTRQMSDSPARQFIYCSKFHNWSSHKVFSQPSMSPKEC